MSPPPSKSGSRFLQLLCVPVPSSASIPSRVMAERGKYCVRVPVEAPEVMLLMSLCLWHLEKLIPVVKKSYKVSWRVTHYAVIFPSTIHSQESETVCLHMEGARGESRVQISLHLEGKNRTLVQKIFKQNSVSTCVPIKVSRNVASELVSTLNVYIETEGERISKSSKILLKRRRSSFLVQTDKAVYKPGQRVNFRILAVTEDLLPGGIEVPVIDIQDPQKNRISQWLNVRTFQPLIELSLPLSFEPLLGEYSIHVKDTVHTFTVEKYVLPKFEVTLQFPKVVMFDSNLFPLRVCGRYTFGKPVQGNYTVTVCQKHIIHWWITDDGSNTDICANFTGQLDRSGCHIIEVKCEDFMLRSTDMERVLKGEATIAEDGTGTQLSTASQTSVSDVINKLSFVDADKTYKVGIPYNGVIKVVDAGDNPIPGMNVYLTNDELSINKTLVTDDKGQVSFTLDTNGWQGFQLFRARTNLKITSYVSGFGSPSYGDEYLRLLSFYTSSKSYLKLHSLDRVLPCEGQQDLQLEYIIKHTVLKNEMDHLVLHYLVISKGSIRDFGSLEISTNSKNEDLHGKATFKLQLHAGKSSTLQAIVYTLLPDGEMLADSANYKVQRCFKNKVSVGFSSDEVLPGSDVSLQVQAAPGSLCGLRVVDQSVVLMRPEKELTADKVFDQFPYHHSGEYDYRINEFNGQCMSWWHLGNKGEDVHSSFEGINLKIITSADIWKPKNCSEDFDERQWNEPIETSFLMETGSFYSTQEEDIPMKVNLQEQEQESEPIRAYFPETWIWELVEVGDSGSAAFNHKSPDTITDWNAGAICLGKRGFGLSPSASLRVFKPFFVDLALPYSVVRGETFNLKASVFNYLRQCIKIKVTLGDTEELEQTPCRDCIYNRCLCANESKTFYWNLKAIKLGEVNLTVRTEAINTEELCQNEIPIVPKQRATDTIVKPLLVQPGGVLVEKSHSSLLCTKEGEGEEKIMEGRDHLKTDVVSLKIPKNILKDSERAVVTVLGDIMGTALQNLDHLLAMPYGCGEQNMVLFAPNIFILQYLEKTHQLTAEIKNKATKFLESGYQRQLNYKRDDGSYSAFGKRDPQGNTWLSAFVVKSFSQAQPYIFIDDGHLNQSFTWLKNIRNENGCFRSVGRLFNNAMKGGLENDISLSAYVTIALVEAGISLEDSLVKDAVSCLSNVHVYVTNVYTLALLAYTYTLCGELELRKAVLEKLEKKAVRGDGQVHWKRDSTAKQDSFWYRAPSAEVEMTAYVLLSLISGPEPDMGKAAMIVNWLSKQQNPYGGFSSTQDTVVALQALAMYSGLTFSDKSDVTVIVGSSTGFLEEFHVDKNNRLLLQRTSLPTINGTYTVTSTGNGCVFVQAILRYNVPTPRSDTSFSLKVSPHSTRECLGDPVTSFEILISAMYIGARYKSNMAVIEVRMLSGYIPIKSTVRKLEMDRLTQRSEMQADMITLYLNEVGHNAFKLSFMVEKDIEVKDMKPATAKVYDYYETDEQAVAEYSHPCNTGIPGFTYHAPCNPLWLPTCVLDGALFVYLISLILLISSSILCLN
ncbi:alpha-2-macroglobulin-like protein 1 [Mantella aurantiaca]